MTKLKIAPSIILFVKLAFSLCVTLPNSGLYFYSVFYPLALVFVGENNQFLPLLAFLGIFVLHTVFVFLYFYCKKATNRIFGIGTIILLIADVIGFISVFPNLFAIVGVIIDIVCILLIILSFFDEAKIKTIFKKPDAEINNHTEDNANDSTDSNVYKL